MVQKRKKVLFLSPLPPPHYGSALSSEACLNILQTSKEFEVHSIKLNFAKTMNNIGQINLSQITGVFAIKKQIQKEL